MDFLEGFFPDFGSEMEAETVPGEVFFGLRKRVWFFDVLYHKRGVFKEDIWVGSGVPFLIYNEQFQGISKG